MSGFGACRTLLDVSLIHFVVNSLSQLKYILGLADQRAHASTFECVRLCSEGKIRFVSDGLPSHLSTGVSSMVFYYTSLNLSDLQNWYSKNLNMTVTSGVDQIDWVIKLTAAKGTVEFRPFHPRNITNNPASFIPHLLEEFDGHGLSYTFNFNTSTEVDR